MAGGKRHAGRQRKRDAQGQAALDRARRERDRRRDAEVVELPELGPADMMARVPAEGQNHEGRTSERGRR
jgi:hypothetical protein